MLRQDLVAEQEEKEMLEKNLADESYEATWRGEHINYLQAKLTEHEDDNRRLKEADEKFGDAIADMGQQIEEL